MFTWGKAKTGKHKYGAKTTEVDGIKFPSRKEANYYCELKILQRAGEIKSFERQVKFQLQPPFDRDGKHHREIAYIADFVITFPNGSQKVIDVKGYRTDVYNMKKKMLLFRYPQLVFEEV